NDARGVPEIHEDHAAVIATAGHPAGELDGRSGVGCAQPAGLMGPDHGRSPSNWSLPRHCLKPSSAAAPGLPPPSRKPLEHPWSGGTEIVTVECLQSCSAVGRRQVLQCLSPE